MGGKVLPGWWICIYLVVVIIMAINCGIEAQLYSTVEQGDSKVFTFYPDSGSPVVRTGPQPISRPTPTLLRQVVAPNTEISASTSMDMDANSIATLFQKDASFLPQQPQAPFPGTSEDQTLAHRKSSYRTYSSPPHRYLARRPSGTFSSPSFSQLVAPWPHQTHVSQPQPYNILSSLIGGGGSSGGGSLSSYYSANVGGTQNVPAAEPADAGSEILPHFSFNPSSIAALMDTATQSLQQYYPTPLNSFSSIYRNPTHTDSYPSPSASFHSSTPEGGGWPGPPRNVVHLPTVYHHEGEHHHHGDGGSGHHEGPIIHDAPITHEGPVHHEEHTSFEGPIHSGPIHDPFGPKAAPILQYVKNTVAAFPWSPYAPYGKSGPPLSVFSTVGKTLDATLGGAWAARRAIKKGLGTVISSKVRLGGTLAYVGSELLAKTIDVAANL